MVSSQKVNKRLFIWREIRLRRTLPPLEVNSSGSTLTPGRDLTVISLLTDLLQIHYFIQIQQPLLFSQIKPVFI